MTSDHKALLEALVSLHNAIKRADDKNFFDVPASNVNNSFITQESFKLDKRLLHILSNEKSYKKYPMPNYLDIHREQCYSMGQELVVVESSVDYLKEWCVRFSNLIGACIICMKNNNEII